MPVPVALVPVQMVPPLAIENGRFQFRLAPVYRVFRHPANGGPV